MFDTTSAQQAFFSFLNKAPAFLFISDASDLKRTFFLNELLEALEQKKIVCFRSSDPFDLARLIDQITDCFSIPVRAVNVDLTKQLQEQLAILQHMKQSLVFLIEETQQLSFKNLSILLKMAALQPRFPIFSIVLSGKPILEKKLAQMSASALLKLEVLHLGLDSELTPICVKEKLNLLSQCKQIAGNLAKPVSLFYQKRFWIRLASIACLVLFMAFLSQRERLKKPPLIHHKQKTSLAISNTKKQVPVKKDELSRLKIQQAIDKPSQQALMYLNVIQQQLGDQLKIQFKREDTPPHLLDVMPELPLPTSMKSIAHDS